MTNYPRNIVNAFGGVRAMARRTGYARSTVSSWLRSRSIPDAHKAPILAAALQQEIPLTKEDFFPVADPIPS